MMLIFCLSEEMSPHFKLHMESFSYFVRWFYFLALTFYQVNKNSRPKADLKMLRLLAGTAILKHVLFVTQTNRGL